MLVVAGEGHEKQAIMERCARERVMCAVLRREDINNQNTTYGCGPNEAINPYTGGIEPTMS